MSFWEQELYAPPWVIDTIKHGLILPLRTEPTPYNRPNQLSATSNSQWVDDAIAELVSVQYILEVREKPYFCSPLSVVENSSGKRRLVVNTRHVNISFSSKGVLNTRTCMWP